MSFESSKRQRKKAILIPPRQRAQHQNHPNGYGEQEKDLKTLLRTTPNGRKSSARDTAHTKRALKNDIDARNARIGVHFDHFSRFFSRASSLCIGFKTRASLPFFTTRKRTQKNARIPVAPRARSREPRSVHPERESRVRRTFDREKRMIRRERAGSRSRSKKNNTGVPS